MTAKSTSWFYAFGKATANNFPRVAAANAGTGVNVRRVVSATELNKDDTAPQ